VDLVDWRRTEASQTSWNRPVMSSLPNRNAGPVNRRFGTAAIRADAATKSQKREVPSLSPGDRVLHDSFGMGSVVSLDGMGDNAVASIDFGSEGVKRLLLRYAPVEKL
jgi:DNA helicase II / ATP-dependent DNA helicase PcrA